MLNRIRANWQKRNFHDRILIAISVLFLLVVIAFMISHRAGFTPDQFFALGLVVALVLGQAQAFIWDWTPLILLILSYEYLRGLIPKINHHIHFALMPDFDKLIFAGHVPSVVLQQKFFNPMHLHWYDYTAAVIYASHFVVPMLVGFGFWLSDRHYFREYAIAFLSLSYLTFLTYLAFPAAPPWMAAEYGVIPHIQELTAIITTHLFPSVSLPTLYRYFGANLTAAVPSLHAAYPLLTSIFVVRKLPKLWPIMAVYTLSVWLAVIYLGEHYFFDVMLGAVYALVVYVAVERIKKHFQPALNPVPVVAADAVPVKSSVQ